MTGLTNLNQLIAQMEPTLADETYVFCTFPNQTYGFGIELRPICAYQEAEGLTLIIAQEEADRAGLSYDLLYRPITLNIHSSLEAVGLTAAVATQLTTYNISANVVAAYFHDHIFVPAARAAEAVAALRQLSQQARS